MIKGITMVLTHKDGTAAAILANKSSKVVEANAEKAINIANIALDKAEYAIEIAEEGSSATSYYEYVQSVPSDEWHIEHNLGRNPSVTVIDSAGTNVIGDYEYVDYNNVILHFRGSFSGTAFLN